MTARRLALAALAALVAAWLLTAPAAAGQRPTGTASSREFTGLRHVSYVLEVTARGHAGRLPDPVSFPFRVAPPPWLRWWALVGYALVILAAGYGAVRSRLRTLERDKRRLERTLAERTEELRHRDDELAEACDRAMQATKAKSEFLANISHEIRTPMNAILGYSGLGLKLDAAPTARDYFRRISVSGHSLLAVVNDILDFSKIEAGRLDLERAPFELMPLLGQVSDLFSLKTGEKGLALLITAAPDVPCQLVGDPLRLSQVLTNLVGNAIKFTATGHVIARVDLVERLGDRARLRFSVEDTGIGMTPAQQNRIFQAFSQADASTTRKYGGTGLGLTISKCLVEMMDGTIEVASVPGRGSTFTFTVSVDCASEATLAASVPPGVKGRHALLMVRSAAVRETLSHQLREMGLRVTPTDSVESAIRALGAAPADLLVVDWCAPGTFGVDVARTIRVEAGCREIPTVVSISSLDLEAAPPEERGTWTPLIEPIHPGLLIDVIECAVEGPSARQSSARGPAEGSANERQIRGLRVLLAEDSAINQDVAKAVLRGAGIEVDVAATGAEAVRMVEAKTYDVVLMDIQMPEMDGYEATARIRENWQYDSLPIIAMTAHAMSGVREECLDAGMNDYVGKPIDEKELFAALARWAGRADAGVPDELPDRGAPATTARVPVNGDRPVSGGVDFSRLVGQLRGDEELAVQLLGVFVTDYADHVQKVRQAVDAGDWTCAGRLVHTVKGVSGTLGATGLYDASVDLERAMSAASSPDAIANQGGTVAEPMARFAGALDAAVAACRALVQTS
ncbi:MAG TPA: response regulator [Vicinamibacterales bacterium]